jgi:hypothetical protein
MVSLAGEISVAGETITAIEVEGYFYSNGDMKRSSAQFEITYYLEGDTITRTRVYDFKRKEVIPDNTIYRVQRQLSSDPSNNKVPSYGNPQVIRAIGQPGTDAVEVLMIGDTFVQTVKSARDYFVISRLKRIQ